MKVSSRGNAGRCGSPRWGLGIRCVAALVVAFGLVLGPQLQRLAAAAAVLAQITGQHALDPLARRVLLPIQQRDMRLTLDDETIRARRYTPVRSGAHLPGVVLLHGVHARGIDEPHLVAFARSLAAGGLDVLTPELPELLRYRLGLRTVEDIRQLARIHAADSGTPGVGVIGISFAGGLSLLAAAEQGPTGAIAYVVSVGGHDDLLRLCQYYAGQDVRGPNGESVQVAAHPYGARVMIREHLARFLPSQDLALGQRALDAYLRDRSGEARKLAQGMSPAGREVMAILLDAQQHQALASLLARAVDAVRPQLMAASPHGHLAGIHVPVFLIHGSDDPIIPSIETRYLARELPRAWLRQSVITPLLRHTEFPEPPKIDQAWQLVCFLKGIYEAAGSSARAVATVGP